MKDFAKSFYKSKRWQKCREGFIQSRQAIDGGLCQNGCGQLGFIVHHKIKLTPENIENPSIAVGWDNLEFVCKDCHDRIHDQDIHGETRCYFGADGQPIPRT